MIHGSVAISSYKRPFRRGQKCFFKGPSYPQEIASIMLFSGTIVALITTGIILKHYYQRHKPATHCNILIKQNLTLNMATGREDSHHGGRTKWKDNMFIDLISCREQASTIYSTEECPRKENGKR